jgi:L-threonylcarbamoyladenylate synthase
LIVHLADASQLSQWAREIPDAAHKLAAKFWPGPLTLILRRAPGIGNTVAAGQDTIGVRVPAHLIAHALLTRFGGGIAAPSANRFGHLSATTAAHVRHEFGEHVDCVLDGGQSAVGIESTIIDVSGPSPALLRPGYITAAAVEQVIGVLPGTPRPDGPRAPGTLAAHYMPSTPLFLVAAQILSQRVMERIHQRQRVAVLARAVVQTGTNADVTWLMSPSSATDYAHELYANLRHLDAVGCSVILVEQPPQTIEWAAINDRLERAAAGSR